MTICNDVYILEDNTIICMKCVNDPEMRCACNDCPVKDSCQKVCCLPLLPFNDKTPKNT